MPKILISDKLSETALQIFRDNAIEVDFKPDLGKDKEALLNHIADYDGLAIRSATKVTEKLLNAAPRLKVIGRAGIGVDNVDLNAATRNGVIVMNTPFGNSITTAEHAIAMMFAVARQIPEANASTHQGLWEKSRFIGVELTNKILGVIGAGNIGAIVAGRAIGLKMRVIAYDPYLSQERAALLGVEKVELDDLIKRADFISLHVPKTEQTANILSKERIADMKKGVRIINCARGGLVDEEALAEALTSGHVAGAAFDVFTHEPAIENPLFNLNNVVVTPHLGAATKEAQENVALQIAEQMSNYLNYGAVSNAINMPSISAEEAPLLTPFVKLATHLGSFAGQMTQTAIESVHLLYNGAVASMNVKALDSAALAGLMKAQTPDVNMVSAPLIATERGIKLRTSTEPKDGIFDSYIKMTVKTKERTHTLAGTVFSDGKPRFIQIKGINLDAEVGRYMLYTTHRDIPGMIGLLGNTLSNHAMNIANFTLGRSDIGGDAIALLLLDEAPHEALLKDLRASKKFNQVAKLEFDIS